MKQIKRFVDEQPAELIVLYTHKFRSGFRTLEEHDAFVDLIKECFPDHASIFVPKAEFHLTYSELKKKGRKGEDIARKRR